MQHEFETSVVPPVVSVVICTYNRAAMLLRALETVFQQDAEPGFYEVIVVDNNSKDDTHRVVEEFQTRHPALRYCYESRQGLSHARNCGWGQARGQYVAYIDDDCEVPPDWLSSAREIIAKVAPAAFGGSVRIGNASDRPQWFKDSYLYQNSVSQARFLGPKEYGKIVGMNMFFRSDLIEMVGGFDPEFGMAGNRIAYGEETAFLKAVAARLPDQLYFDPGLYVYDITRPEKMQLGYTLRASFAAGRSFCRLRGNRYTWVQNVGALIQLARAITGLVIGVLQNCVFRDRNRYPYIENYIYEVTAKYMREIGVRYEQIFHLFYRSGLTETSR